MKRVNTKVRLSNFIVERNGVFLCFHFSLQFYCCLCLIIFLNLYTSVFRDLCMSIVACPHMSEPWHARIGRPEAGGMTPTRKNVSCRAVCACFRAVWMPFDLKFSPCLLPFSLVAPKAFFFAFSGI